MQNCKVKCMLKEITTKLHMYFNMHMYFKKYIEKSNLNLTLL